MRHIPIYLWKEWREHRAALGVMLGSLALVAAMALTYFGWKVEDAVKTFYWLPAVCGLGALITVGSDLFSRDNRPKHAQFCERIPASLAPSYWSKLAFFTAVIAGSVLFGLLLCNLALWLTGAESHSLTPGGIFWPATAVAVAICYWVFAVSAWSPTTVATVPGTLAIGALLVLPIGFVYEQIYPALKPNQLDYWALFPSTVIGAVVSGRVCYGNITLRRKPKAFRALTSIGIAALSFLPAYIPLGADLVSWINRPYRIQDVVVSSGSRNVFVHLIRSEFITSGSGNAIEFYRYSKSSAIRLSMEDLAVAKLGQGHIKRLPIQHVDWNGTPGDGRVGVVNFDSESGEKRLRSVACEVYELKSGNPLPTDPMNGKFPSVNTLPGVWQVAYPEAVGPRSSGFGTRERLGLSYPGKKPLSFHSPCGTTLTVPAMKGSSVRVLEYGFLHRVDNRWLFRDELNTESNPTDAIFGTEDVCALLSDGTVLLVTLDGELVIADPRTGNRESIQYLGDNPPLRGTRPHFMASGSRDRIPLDVAAPLVVSVSSGEGRMMDLALVDFVAREWRPHPAHRGENLIVAWSEGPEAIVIEHPSRLVHVNLETGTRRLLLDANDL